MKIAVVGSLNMDLVVKIPRIPSPGETLLGGEFKTHPGGKGANQAVAAARMGGDVYMVGCTGDDAFGRELRSTLEKDGINTSCVFIQPETATGVALIQVDDQGRNSIAVAPGANYRLTVSDIQNAFEKIGRFDILVVQFEIPMETVYSAIRLGAQMGAKIIVNPAPAQSLPPDILALVDYLIPNEFELAILLHKSGMTEQEIHENIGQIQAFGCKNCIVTLGKNGSLAVDQTGHEWHIPAYTVQAVDSTAAGDCFVGALAVGLSEGKPLDESIKFASAAASISVTREGAQPSIPSRDEVQKFIYERNN
jgi:ribokinase